VDVELGEPLQLRRYGGPNVALLVLSVDATNIHCATRDYDQPVPTIGNGVISFLPSVRTWQVERNFGFNETRTEIYATGTIKAYYVEDTNVGGNHVTVEVEPNY
jgi:hypothetical protein